jgi:predicted S18 family serine protease
MGGERMSDKLQQIRNILASHFGLTDENEDGTYLYHLTRSKEAFSYGTMTLDDFVEVDEEFLDQVFEDIKPVIEELQNQIEQQEELLIKERKMSMELYEKLQQAQEKVERYEEELKEIAKYENWLGDDLGDRRLRLIGEHAKQVLKGEAK